jgi:hypothetical protein
MDEFLADNGMALRYKREINKNQPRVASEDQVDTEGNPVLVEQETKGAGAFSEIGFYNKKSKWPDSVASAGDLDQRLPEDKFSRVDVLNIQSAGDIESRAENYQLLKAKRIEFLSDADEVSAETRAGNCRDNFSKWERGNAPLGDSPLDDPALHKGDVHFRAGKNIIFKSLEEIRIEVGRTTLIIDDSGFSVVTRKINSSVPIPNDTSFNMNSRDGITMFGEAVNIAAARKFSVADAWGGSVGSMVGVLNISGRQIGQRTYDKAQQNYALGMNGMTLARNITIGSMATSPQANFAAGWVAYTFDWIKFLIETGKSVYDLTKTYKNYSAHADTLQKQRDALLNQHASELRQSALAEMALQQDNAGIRRVMANLNNEIAIVEDERNNPSMALESTTNVLDTASRLVGAEPVEALMAALDLVLTITSSVYAVVEQSYSAAWRVDLAGSLFNGETKDWTPQKRSDFRDLLNIIALSIDSGVIEAAMGLMSAASAIGMGGPASIRLRQSGDMVIQAGEQKQLYAELSQNASVPPSIATEKTTANVKTALAITKAVTGAAKLIFQAESRGNKIPAFLEKL